MADKGQVHVTCFVQILDLVVVVISLFSLSVIEYDVAHECVVKKEPPCREESLSRVSVVE